MSRKSTAETETRLVKKEFLVDLTAKEREARLETSHSLEKDIDALKTEIKLFTNGKKAEIKVIETERTKIRQALKLNKEPRIIGANEVLDYKAGTVTYMKGNDVLETREMYDQERQTTLLKGTQTTPAKKKAVKRNVEQNIKSPASHGLSLA